MKGEGRTDREAIAEAKGQVDRLMEPARFMEKKKWLSKATVEVAFSAKQKGKRWGMSKAYVYALDDKNKVVQVNRDQLAVGFRPIPRQIARAIQVLGMTEDTARKTSRETLAQLVRQKKEDAKKSAAKAAKESKQKAEEDRDRDRADAHYEALNS